MLVAFLQLLLIITIILILIKPGIGICLYLAYYFLIPTMELSFVGLDSIRTSFVFAIVFIIANIGNLRNIKKIDLFPFLSFLILYSTLLLLTFFSSKAVPWDFIIKNFLKYIVVQIFIIPVGIYLMIKSKPYILNRINKTMIFVIVVITLYGLVLTMMPGSNPYIEMLGDKINLQEIHLGTAEGRMFGAISSVFVHPMSYGSMLGLSLFFIFFLSKQKGSDSVFYVVLSILIVLCIFFCGVRSALASLMGTGLVYLLLRHKFALLLKALLLSVFVFYCLSFIPELNAYVGSIFQMQSDDVGGSSIFSRLTQLEACILEVKDNMLFGNGYSWHSYYIYLNDGYGHPIIHGWESLLFVTITDSGLVGIVIWIVFIIYFCLKIKDIGIICLFANFTLYRLATGLFGEDYFYVFLAIYICSRDIYSQLQNKKIQI